MLSSMGLRNQQMFATKTSTAPALVLKESSCWPRARKRAITTLRTTWTRIEKVDKLADNDNEVVEGQLEKTQRAMVGKMHDKLRHSTKTSMDSILMKLAGLRRSGDDGNDSEDTLATSDSASSGKSGLGEPMNDALAHLGIKKVAPKAGAKASAKASAAGSSGKRSGGASASAPAPSKRDAGFGRVKVFTTMSLHVLKFKCDLLSEIHHANCVSPTSCSESEDKHAP